MHHGHYGDDRRYSDNIINDRKVTFGVGVHVLDCLDDEYNFQSLLLAKFCYASFFSKPRKPSLPSAFDVVARGGGVSVGIFP